MTYEPLTPDDILPGNTLEIECDGEYVYLRDKTFPQQMLCIPIQNWGGVFAGNSVGQSVGRNVGQSVGNQSANDSEFQSAILAAEESVFGSDCLPDLWDDLPAWRRAKGREPI